MDGPLGCASSLLVPSLFALFFSFLLNCLLGECLSEYVVCVCLCDFYVCSVNKYGCLVFFVLNMWSTLCYMFCSTILIKFDLIYRRFSAALLLDIGILILSIMLSWYSFTTEIEICSKIKQSALFLQVFKHKEQIFVVSFFGRSCIMLRRTNQQISMGPLKKKAWKVNTVRTMS